MSYRPQPIDTSRVAVPADLLALSEQLAEHNHDTWSLSRLGQGWVYGPHRNDTRKEHPGLVPYETLDEAEKDIDRHTVECVIKAILALGYEIRPAAGEGRASDG